MKNLIKQILKESMGDMIIVHENGRDYAKDINSFNELFFQKIDSQGLGAYVITKDIKHFSTIEKVTSKGGLNKFKTFNRVDMYIIPENVASKIEKIISKTNEIITLKYDSIKLMSQHAHAAINEYYKKKNERNDN